ncbi:MAG: homoserine dehydrogenase [Clostridia bacterium]|nr:homoserine dehydrogenase [Clostridia bacterium]
MKKHGIAILGFGVVGGGVADLITNNREEIKSYLGCEVEIKRILDLRDFPSSPFSSLVTHDFTDVINDEDVDTVMEMMGGSHPAYEYTVASLKAGKNVITSNKEVVANFGDEFVRIAKEMGVSYRFEAAVGGGIPVINPLLGCVRQNKIHEVRGILNGTTNYILTKMFTYGDSFENALADAQAKGYAEANPAADVEGTDACRKITILTALATDKLYDVKTVHTEGITGIRKADVLAAEKLSHKIKLLGRCIAEDGVNYVMVCPFLLPSDSPLSTVSGVYNAVEVVGDPLGNVMFYGQGAGAGATASAVVGDLLPIIAYGSENPIVPGFNRVSTPADEAFLRFESKKYIALPKGNEEKVREIFGNVDFIESEECAFITECESEARTNESLEAIGVPCLSKIRFL